MNIVTATIDYRDGDTQLEGFLAHPENATTPLPAVLIAHMWGGRVEFVCDKARQLATHGYAAFALDMYGKGVIGRNPEESAKLMQPFMDDRHKLQQRISTAFKTVRNLPQVDPHRIAVIGYCFGGLCALDLARSGTELRAAVSIHGLLDPPPDKGRIKCRILLLHGSDDPQADMRSLLALQQELSESKVDWQSVIYGNTQHAFTNPAANNPAAGTVYSADADRRSWTALLNFLKEALEA